MSIQILGGVFGSQGVLPGAGKLPGGEEGDSRPTTSTGGDTRNHAAALPGTGPELPHQAPPGTDPNLWSVLTAEERGFFARAQAMGPVTYGRSNGNGTEPPLQRGSRIDVRV
jgi:hypothetical protein